MTIMNYHTEINAIGSDTDKLVRLPTNNEINQDLNQDPKIAEARKNAIEFGVSIFPHKKKYHKLLEQYAALFPLIQHKNTVLSNGLKFIQDLSRQLQEIDNKMNRSNEKIQEIHGEEAVILNKREKICRVIQKHVREVYEIKCKQYEQSMRRLHHELATVQHDFSLAKKESTSLNGRVTDLLSSILKNTIGGKKSSNKEVTLKLSQKISKLTQDIFSLKEPKLDEVQLETVNVLRDDRDLHEADTLLAHHKQEVETLTRQVEELNHHRHNLYSELQELKKNTGDAQRDLDAANIKIQRIQEEILETTLTLELERGQFNAQLDVIRNAAVNNKPEILRGIFISIRVLAKKERLAANDSSHHLDISHLVAS